MPRDRAAGPEAKPLRLFFAFDVPDSAKDAVERVVAEHRSRVPARWTGRSAWHVTVKFLGRTWPRLVPEVEAAAVAASATSRPFRTSLDVIGVFPSSKRARVVWVGLKDPDGRFGAMAARLDRALEDFFVAEDRALTPHLTVARLNPPRDLGEFDPSLVGSAVSAEPFDVDRLVLYRSHLSPAGARYEAVGSWPLGG